MTNKKTQHDSLNVEQTLISSEAFIDKYKKPIMYVFIAIVVLVGGYFLYRSFVSEPREAKANELMFKGQQYFASDNYEKALNGDGQGFPGFLKIRKLLPVWKISRIAAMPWCLLLPSVHWATAMQNWTN